MSNWKKVDVQGRLYSLTRGDRAGRVEKDGDEYEAKIGRRRGQAPRRYWTWETIGRFPTPEQGMRAVEARLPAGR